MMSYQNSRSLSVISAVAALLATASCAAQGDTVAMAPLEKPDLTVAVVPTTDSTGFFVAMYEGLFTAQGLHITYKAVPSGEGSVNEQALGKFDVLDGSYVSDIEAQVNWDRGVRPTDRPNPSVSQIAANLDFIAGASVMQPDAVGLFTLPGSPVRAAGDLAGKTIGINAPGNLAYLLVAEYLRSNGISPQSVRLKYFSFPQMTRMLLEHKIDAAFLEEPFLSTAEESVGVAELTNLDDGAVAEFPMRGYTVTKEFARRYPRTLAAFERALQEGQEIADTNRHIAELAMEAFKATDGVTAQTAAIMTFDSYPVGAIDATDVQRVADDMLQFGLLRQRFNVRQMIG
jgi:NitT/TauT family transport system substrate-binding protein